MNAHVKALNIACPHVVRTVNRCYILDVAVALWHSYLSGLALKSLN